MYIWGMHNFNIFNRCCYNPMLQFGLFSPMMWGRMTTFMMPVFNYYPRTYYQPWAFALPQNNLFEQFYRYYSKTDDKIPHREHISVGESVIDISDNPEETEKTQETQETTVVETVSQPVKPAAVQHVSVSVKPSGKGLDKNVLKQVKKMAKSLNCNYEDLLAVINSESSFNTQAGYNPKTGKIGPAVGLLQFTKLSIKELNRVYGLNLTKEKILNMSAAEQLDLAEKYLLIAKSYKFSRDAKLSAADLYAITFLPGRANSEILCREGERGSDGKLLNYYEGNWGLDINNDKKITKTELAQRIDRKRVDESIFA